jgi:hypothetical protein
MAEALYQKKSSAGGDSGKTGGSAPVGEDVVDAEYTEVK